MGVVDQVRDPKTGARYFEASKRRARLEREFFTLAWLRHPRSIRRGRAKRWMWKARFESKPWFADERC
jgi:hypothetical protein